MPKLKVLYIFNLYPSSDDLAPESTWHPSSLDESPMYLEALPHLCSNIMASPSSSLPPKETVACRVVPLCTYCTCSIP